MIRQDGYPEYCIWEHSQTVRELYEKRCSGEAEEMTCAAQAAEILEPHVRAGDGVLDVGCGSGYLFHSLARRSLPVEYYGVDAAPSLIAIGRRILPRFGLSEDRLQVARIEDLNGSIEHIVCLNVLSNIDNYHRPLERLLHCARKTVILRESCNRTASYRYVLDDYLERPLKVYVNTYETEEFMEFIRSYGFSVECIEDRRTGGEPESIIGYLHHWKFFVAVRRG